MKCEICGREANLRKVIVEGVEMMVCSGCSKYGATLKDNKKPIVKPKKKSAPYSKDVFKDMALELITNWGKTIKKAREQKNLTREELGAKVSEKTITIAKIENEELRPTDQTVRKIERELNISLFQKVEGTMIKHGKSTGLTLGDLLKNAK